MGANPATSLIYEPNFRYILLVIFCGFGTLPSAKGFAGFSVSFLVMRVSPFASNSKERECFQRPGMHGSLAKRQERAKSFVTLALSGSKLDSHECILPSTVIRVLGELEDQGNAWLSGGNCHW
jgi:hypothetical protein